MTVVAVCAAVGIARIIARNAASATALTADKGLSPRRRPPAGITPLTAEPPRRIRALGSPGRHLARRRLPSERGARRCRAGHRSGPRPGRVGSIVWRARLGVRGQEAVRPALMWVP